MSISRREFVVGTVATLAAAKQRAAKGAAPSKMVEQAPPPGFVADLAAASWRLWHDAAAPWQNDVLYLPEDTPALHTLPVHPPTGGWDVLDNRLGREVRLPASLEQYATNPLGNRSVVGVGWFWRSFIAPAVPPEQRLVVQFRGARLRSEVYVNRKLCSYFLLTELPFEADITTAIQPGKSNTLAVRITNPGGTMAWEDWGSIGWGNYQIPDSRGIGGLDAGINLCLRNLIEISDLWLLNRPEPNKATVHAVVRNASQKPWQGQLALTIRDDARVLWQKDISVSLAAGQEQQITAEATVANIVRWDLDHPKLYTLEAVLPDRPNSGQRKNVGFRWFTATGIGSNAMLTLNDKRIVLRSAISWGWWGGSGLWPDKSTALREITAAQTLGLNCLQAHRNLVKEAVIDLQDQMGLLRYQEPGSGQSVWTDAQGYQTAPPTKPPINTTGVGGEPTTFRQKYEWAKIQAMIHRDRSHPSLVIWCMQNEWAGDLNNPHIFRLLREVHQLDPSRILVLKSGDRHYWNEAYMLPYDQTIYHENGQRYCGWHDVHGNNYGGIQWRDEYYKNPDNYWMRSTDKKEIVMWGEITGSGVTDNHEAIVQRYQRDGKESYDLAYHRNMLNIYDGFLQRWGFRKAFATASDLFEAIGTISYFYNARVIEQLRICNTTDYIVLSGWESTAIDNFSGIVDNLRQFKADPKILAHACRRNLVVLKPRRLVLETGESTPLDIFAVTESLLGGTYTLALTEGTDRKRKALINAKSVKVAGGNVFSNLLAEGILLKNLPTGYSQLRSTLHNAVGKMVADGTAAILVVEPIAPHRASVSATANPALQQYLTKQCGAALVAPEHATVHLHTDAPNAALFAQALTEIASRGSRLAILPANIDQAAAYAKLLASAGVLRLTGLQQGNGTPWMSCWYFIRKHWVFAGLPADCALDWRYQLHASDACGGLQLSAGGMDVFAGFGSNPGTQVSIAGCTIPHGKGTVVLLTIPGIVESLENINGPITRPISRRMLANLLIGPASA